MAVTRTLTGAKGLSPSLAAARTRAIPAASRSLAPAFRPTTSRTATPGVGPHVNRFLAAAQQQQQQQQQPQPGGLAGLWNNATQLVTGFVPGIAHFVGDVFQDVTAVPHALIDVARGDFEPDISKYFPASTGIVRSFGRTGMDILNPSRFVEAYQQGDLISKIVEDVGNAAIVFGPAGKAIGSGASVSAMTADEAALAGARGGLRGLRLSTAEEIAAADKPSLAAVAGPEGELANVGKAPQQYYTGYRGLAGRAAEAGNYERAAQLNQIGNKIRGVATLGEKVANAPAAVYTKPLGGLAKLAGFEQGLSGVAQAITKRLPENLGGWRYSPEGTTTRAAGDLATEANVRLTSAAIEPAMLSKALGLSTAEDQVALMGMLYPKENLLQFGEVGADGRYVIDDQALTDILNEKYQGMTEGTRATPEAARTAAQWAKGELSPQSMANIAEVQGKIFDFAKERQGRYIAAGGNQAQLGTELLPSVVEEHRQFLQNAQDRLAQGPLAKAQTQADRIGRDLQVKDVLANDLPEPAAMAKPEIRSQLQAKRGQLSDLSRLRDEAEAKGDYRAARATDAQVDVVLDDISSLESQAGWIRYKGRTKLGEVTEPPSLNERIRQQQGDLARRHADALATVGTLERRHATLGERLANVENDLRQSFQDRYHTKVNLPSIVRLTNAMYVGTARLPTLLRRLGEGELADAVAKGTIAGEDVIGRIESAGRVLTDVERAQLEHSVKAGAAEAAIADHMQSLADDTTGERLVSPEVVHDIINEAGLPEHTMPAVQGAYDTYLLRRVKAFETVFNDQTAAMPARFRKAAMDGQRQAAALIEQATKANADVPGSGNEFLQQAEETMTTLKEMADSGFDPAHLTGGKEVSPGQAGSRGYANGRLTQTRLRGGHVSTHGIQQLSTEAYGQIEANQARTWVKNKRNEYLGATLGKPLTDFPEAQAALAQWADLHPGDPMPPAELAKTARGLKDQDGVEYAAMDPAANVTPESMVVPKKVFDHFQDPGQMSLAMRGLQRTNRAFKTWVLPFSGRWQVGNAIGNVLQASMHAGVGPIELGRIAHGLIKEQGGYRALWKNEGLMPGLPRTISLSGLTHGEMESVFGQGAKEAGTRFGRRVEKISRGSYKFNSVVDNLTRSSVYIAKLAEGQGSEAALRTTMRALGDFTKLNAFERNTVRQIFPFYTWLKHSITATARLPIISPTRAAFFAHLQTLYNDDPNLRKFIGQGFRFGNTGIMDSGSIVPLADLGGEQAVANPMTLGAAVAPGLKFLAAEVAGYDLNTMQKLSRPGSQGTGKISPLTQFVNNPLGGVTETLWQASQQGPTQIRALRDFILGNQVRYTGTGYRTDFTNANRRSPWQIARILSLPNVRYEPRLQQGSS